MKKAILLVTLALACLVVIVSSTAYSASVFAARSDARPGSSLAEVLPRAMPAVVNIAAQGEMSSAPNFPPVPPSYQDQQRRRPRQFESMGSGVIMDASRGYIITNEHVIRDARSITVTLSDGRVSRARLIGSDPASDIALLQIRMNHLQAAPLGNSNTLRVGDFVAAIGNPFGLNQTVTSGIISGLQRSGLGIENYENFIQTDASINPGNSGGALINTQGQVIGINTAIFSPGTVAGNIGIGFAIPINMVQGVMQQLVKYGSVRRGLMGVLVQDLTPTLAVAFNLAGDTGGALIAQVAPFSPAATIGVKTGDIIQEANGQKIQNAAQVRNAVGMLRVGDHISLKLLRRGQTVNVSLVITDPQKYIQIAEDSHPFLFGMSLKDFDQTLATQGHLVGVQVVGITESSLAYRAGLRLGDVILSANQVPIKTVDQLQKIAKESKNKLLVNIVRHGAAAFVVIESNSG